MYTRCPVSLCPIFFNIYFNYRPIKQEGVPDIKKPKAEDSKLDKEIEAQNKIMFKYRDQLQNDLSKKQLEHLFEVNDQQIPIGVEMVFYCISQKVILLLIMISDVG